jgi:hypothetical protein
MISEGMISQETIARNKQDSKIVCCSKFAQFHKKYRKIPDKKLLLLYASSLSIIFVISGSSYPFEFNSVRAESGSGTDIFRVIVTILGADKDSTGDVVALVTVNDNSRVKFLNLDDISKADDLFSERDTSNSSSGPDNQNMIIEYVATFPNVTVNAGDEYKTCVLPMKTLKLMCVDGTNSPGKRPEVVDLNLNFNATTQSTESLTSRPTFVPNSSPEDDQSSTPKNDRDSKDDKDDG